MHSIVNNLRVFKEFFAGKITIKDVSKHLKIYNQNFIDFEKDFYTISINSNSTISDEIIGILIQLNIDFNFWGGYFSQNLSLYQFLKELAKDHELSLQLNLLIDLIEKRKRHGLVTFAKKTAIAALIVLPVLIGLLYPVIHSIITFLLETANFVPAFSIVLSFPILLFNLYLNHLSDRRPSFKIYRDDIFLIASSVLNSAAKIILIVAKSVFASFASLLFIAAALIETTKELFYLLELRKNYLNKPIVAENDLAIIRQQYTRYEYDYLKQRNTLVINLVAALCLTVLVITCSFFPVGFILTLSTCISIASVFLLKHMFLTINERIMSTKLQAELKEIGEHSEKMTVTASSLSRFKESLQIENSVFNSSEEAVLYLDKTDGSKEITNRQLQPGRSNYSFFNKTLHLLAGDQAEKVDEIEIIEITHQP